MSLLELAREIAPEYAQTGKVAAAVAAGSVGRGRTDRYSDLELDIYWSSAPSDADRLGVVHAIGAELDILWPYSPDEGEWAENYHLGGHEVGVSGFQLDWMDAAIDQVTAAANPSVDLQMRLSALNEGVVLFGADLVEGWRRRSTVYSDALVERCVQAFLEPTKLGSWHQRFALLARRDSVALRKLCTRPPEIILGALCGLNRLLIEHHSFKWFAHTADRLPHKPRDLSRRLRLAAESDLTTAVRELDQLLLETLDLVDLRVPAVDTTPMRAELSRVRTT